MSKKNKKEGIVKEDTKETDKTENVEEKKKENKRLI